MSRSGHGTRLWAVGNLVTPKSDARGKRELKTKEGGGERHKSREKKAAAHLCMSGRTVLPIFKL
jgi:hypothetical protein